MKLKYLKNAHELCRDFRVFCGKLEVIRRKKAAQNERLFNLVFGVFYSLKKTSCAKKNPMTTDIKAITVTIISTITEPDFRIIVLASGF